jgi:hypothetical protein
LYNVDATEVIVEDGRCYAKNDSSKGETYADILKRNQMDYIEATSQAESGEEQKQYSMYAFGDTLGRKKCLRIYYTTLIGKKFSFPAFP